MSDRSDDRCGPRTLQRRVRGRPEGALSGVLPGHPELRLGLVVLLGPSTFSPSSPWSGVSALQARPTKRSSRSPARSTWPVRGVAWSPRPKRCSVRRSEDPLAIDDIDGWSAADFELGLAVLQIVGEIDPDVDVDRSLVVDYDETREEYREAKRSELVTTALVKAGG